MFSNFPNKGNGNVFVTEALCDTCCLSFSNISFFNQCINLCTRAGRQPGIFNIKDKDGVYTKQAHQLVTVTFHRRCNSCNALSELHLKTPPFSISATKITNTNLKTHSYTPLHCGWKKNIKNIYITIHDITAAFGIYCCPSFLTLQATAVISAAPFPLPSSDFRNVTSHCGAKSRSVSFIMAEKLNKQRKERERGEISVKKLQETLFLYYANKSIFAADDYVVLNLIHPDGLFFQVLKGLKRYISAALCTNHE